MLKMLPTLTMSATPIRARRSALLFLVTITHGGSECMRTDLARVQLLL